MGKQGPFLLGKNMKTNNKNTKKFKTIGVLGGMSHCACAHLYQLLLKSAQEKFGAVQDDDYPQIIINSIALEGASEHGMEKNNQILNQLVEGLITLENAGADFLIIACNSVHNQISELKRQTNVPIISIVEKVSEEIIKQKPKKILTLTSETTSKYGLYFGLESHGIKLVKPEADLEKKVTNLILAVMGNKDVDKVKIPVIKEIDLMYESGLIDSVLLGCTELPLAITNADTKVKLFDSLKILADAAIKFAKN